MVNSLPPHQGHGGSYYDAAVTWTYFISGIVWIPYTIYLYVCYWESRKRNLFPQAFIIVLLAFGCTLRCIWFFEASYEGHIEVFELISRVAILFQFSAVTLVMLMWSKAFKIGAGSARRSSARGVPITSATTAVAAMEAKNSAIKEQSLIMLRRKYYCLLLNGIAWAIIIFSIVYKFNANGSDLLYQFDEVVLVALSLIASFGIVYIGLRNFFLIKSELSPVYVTPGKEETKFTVSKFTNFLFGYLDINTENTLRAQTQILRSILKVSFVVSFFYAVRAFVFSWRVFYDNDSESPKHWPYLTYPLLFYQLPEFIPNIVIVRGIITYAIA